MNSLKILLRGSTTAKLMLGEVVIKENPKNPLTPN